MASMTRTAVSAAIVSTAAMTPTRIAVVSASVPAVTVWMVVNAKSGKLA